MSGPLAATHGRGAADTDAGLLPRLAELATSSPGTVAIHDDERLTTFGDLWSASLATAGALAAREPGRDDPRAVALLGAPGADLAGAIVAALAAARPFLVLDPHAPAGLLRSLVRESGARLVVTDRRNASQAVDLFPDLDVVSTSLPGAAPPGSLLRAGRRAPALLLPRADRAPLLDAIPRAALDGLLAAVAARSGLAGGDRVATALGPWSEPGLIALLAPLISGATVVIFDAPTAGWADLPRWLRDHEIDALTLTPPLVHLVDRLALPPLRLLVLTPPEPPTCDELPPPAPHEHGDGQTVRLCTGLREAALEPAAGVWHPPERPGLAERAVGAVVALDAGLVGWQFPIPSGPIPVESLPWAPSLTRNWSTVRRELDALVAAGVELPDIDDVNDSPQGAVGPWSTYVLYAFGSWVAPNVARCPATSALIAAVPDVEIAGFTVLAPGTHIPGHRGPYRSVRYQLGVRIPEPAGACRLRVADSILVWEDGKAVAFDDAVDHEAWNDSEESRYVLFVQTAWPVTGPTGRAHRLVHRLLGRAAGDLAGRAAALDRSLNGEG